MAKRNLSSATTYCLSTRSGGRSKFAFNTQSPLRVSATQDVFFTVDIYGGGAHPDSILFGGHEHGGRTGKAREGLQLYSPSRNCLETTTINTLYGFHLPTPFLYATFRTETSLLREFLLLSEYCGGPMHAILIFPDVTTLANVVHYNHRTQVQQHYILLPKLRKTCANLNN